MLLSAPLMVLRLLAPSKASARCSNKLRTLERLRRWPETLAALQEAASFRRLFLWEKESRWVNPYFWHAPSRRML